MAAGSSVSRKGVKPFLLFTVEGSSGSLGTLVAASSIALFTRSCFSIVGCQPRMPVI